MRETTDVIETCAAMRVQVATWRRQNRRIGLVPTMGALHAGHLSLVAESLKRADETIVALFVNPLQFAAGEDLEAYPKPLENDLRLLSEMGVTTVFAPSENEMYPEGYSTTVNPPAVSRKLEGEFRPDHFGGVATVVMKLFQITNADVAFFGQKDFQQVAVVRQMVADLNVPIEIVACPIVREPTGLALSSRNVYLSEEEISIASVLHRALDFFRTEVESGETDGHLVMAEMQQMLIDGGVSSIDYAVVANPQTLDVQAQIVFPTIALIAAFVGKTRLIDNCLIGKGQSS